MQLEILSFLELPGDCTRIAKPKTIVVAMRYGRDVEANVETA